MFIFFNVQVPGHGLMVQGHVHVHVNVHVNWGALILEVSNTGCIFEQEKYISKNV
jgi:hypothetical protein